MIPLKLSAVFLGFSVLVLDQITKWAALRFLVGDHTSPDFVRWLTTLDPWPVPFAQVEITPFFNMVVVWNTGVSFGMLQGLGPLLMIALTGIVTLAIMVWFCLSRPGGLVIAQALVIAGALGNIWDRVRFGAVFDFLDFHVAGWHYPAFNVADSAIVLGVIALAFMTLFRAESPP